MSTYERSPDGAVRGPRPKRAPRETGAACSDRAGAVRPRRRRLARSLWRGGRRRKLVVALAVSVLAAAVAATAYATVRPLPRPGLRRLSSRGSDAERSESGGLVLSFIGRSTTLELG